MYACFSLSFSPFTFLLKRSTCAKVRHFFMERMWSLSPPSWDRFRPLHDMIYRMGTISIMSSFFTITSLHLQPAGDDQLLEKLPVVHKIHAVTAASLVPASEPEQGHDFLGATAALHELLPFRGICL